MQPSVRRSLLISFGQTYGILVVQFVASLVIARLLTPAELGVFSIAAIFIAVGHTLRDLGVVEYIVQEHELDEQRIRSATLLAFIAAWSIGLISWAVAGPIAEFYGVPDLMPLMRILAVNFFLIPFGSVAMAYMRRQMDFARVARIHVSVAFAQSSITVLLAYLGHSYFSMAYAAVCGSALSLLLVHLNRPKGFPFVPAFGALRRVLSFGAFSGTRSLLNEFETGAPDLVLGRLMNMEAVGLFSRAAGLVDLFNRLVVTAANYVALPHLSARVRAGADVTEPYLRAVALITGLAWPFYAFVAIHAGLIVPLLYGDQWHAAVPLVRMICISEMLLAPFCLQGQLAISSGLIRWETARTLASLVLRITPLLLLNPYGLEAAVAGYAVGAMLLAPVSLLMLRRFFAISALEVARSCASSCGLLLLNLAVLGLLHAVLARTQWLPILQLALSGLGFLLVWTVGVRGFRHPLEPEILQVVERVLRRSPAG